MSTNSYEKELRRDIYALRRELRKDLKAVKEYAKENPLAPLTAVKQMSKAEKIMRNTSVSKMDVRQLEKINRRLKHIRGLQSSTYSGAVRRVEHLTDYVPGIENLTPKQIDNLWEAYDKIVDTNAGFKDEKYYILTGIVDVITNSRMSPETLAGKVEQLYNQSIRGVLNARSIKDKNTKLVLQAFKPIL